MSIGAGAAWRDYVSLEGKNSDLVKANQGAIASLFVENRSASKMYLHLFDKISVPTASEVPRFAFPLPAGGSLILDLAYWDKEGCGFSKGIAYGLSSAVGSFAAGSTDATVHIRYW